MRSYLIEDIIQDDFQIIRSTLNDLRLMGPIEDIYYLPIPSELLTQEQKDHVSECGPYFMALEFISGIEMNQLKLELLVRAKNKIRCSCVCYATAEQRNHMVEYLDTLIENLGVKI